MDDVMNDNGNSENESPVLSASSVSVDEQIVSTDTEDSTVKSRLKFRWSKKTIIIIAAAAAAVVVILFLIFHESKFEKVASECVHIAGMVKGRAREDHYFTIDTDPDDPYIAAIPNVQENALKAIQYANEQLGFSGAVYQKMLETSALMGLQSEENKKYRVSWTYHPDYGLEVTYEEK